ncbi:MAG: ROK family protein [Nitrosopumilus sp. H13]|nr:MAG: ROK family protein [Nitrosopumilus sp. H13]
MKIGVDLGGTKTEAVALDDDFGVIRKRRVPTPVQYQEIIDVIESLVSEMAGGADGFSLGVCAPGSVSKKSGLIKNSNTQCLAGRSLKEDLEARLGRKILLENDANCFALAEAQMGAAAGYGTVFGVIMGTGVGGGIVMDGRIYRGRADVAGEWGHHTLHRGGNRCYCGKRGCVEAYISGPALEARWRELAGESQGLPEILESQNARTSSWKSEFLENFGYGLADVINILDPDIVVLGGGLSNIGFLYTEGAESVRMRVFSDIADTPIVQNKLGDSAGVIGACLLSAGP